MKPLDILRKNVLETILNLKDSRKLSDKEFGIKTGLGEKAIDNWKRGNSASYMKHLDEIASYFGVSTDYLLGNEQKNKPDAISAELGPKGKIIWEKLKQIRVISEDDYELAVAQLDLILNRSKMKDKK